MIGIIGIYIKMISLFIDDKNIPCTILKSGPCYITQIKNLKKDGYKAIQIGFIKKKKNINKPILGHFNKSKISPKKIIKEFKVKNIDDFYLGQKITVSLFKKGELVKITSLSKGKGFQGVVKKHGFSGVGERTHGQHNRLRAPGSIGAGSDPSRVFKGTKMSGKMGNRKCTIKNIEILKTNEEKNFIIVKGSIPGGNRNNSYVIIEKLWN